MRWTAIGLVAILVFIAFVPQVSYSRGLGPLIVGAGVGGCIGWLLGTRTTVVQTQPQQICYATEPGHWQPFFDPVCNCYRERWIPPHRVPMPCY